MPMMDDNSFRGRLKERVSHWRDVLSAPREVSPAQPLTTEQAMRLWDGLDAYGVHEGQWAPIQGREANEEFVGHRGGFLALLKKLRIPFGSLVASGMLYVTAYGEEIEEMREQGYLQELGEHEVPNIFLKGMEKGACFKVVSLPNREELRTLDALAMLDVNKTALEALLPEDRQASLGR